MKVSSIKKTDLTKDIIDKILYEGLEDTGETGDCIMALEMGIPEKDILLDAAFNGCYR